MKPILNVLQLKEWDQATCAEQGISSFELLLRASSVAARRIIALFNNNKKPFLIIAGQGNNGGDGFAIAQYLLNEQRQVLLAFNGKEGSEDRNLAKKSYVGECIPLEQVLELNLSNYIVIDALYGFGLTRPLTGLDKEIVLAVNSSNTQVISIDLPSGMPAYPTMKMTEWPYISQSTVLSFQCPKLSFFSADIEPKIKAIEILDIALSAAYERLCSPAFQLFESKDAQLMYKPRGIFSHKGTYGKLLVLGSGKRMPGAVILSGMAALRSGVGTLSIGTPECNRSIVITALPESMWKPAGIETFALPEDDLTDYDTLAFGMGLVPQDFDTVRFNEWLLSWPKPILLDAGALRVTEIETLKKMRGPVILTPHPGEFDHIFGESSSWFERTQKSLSFHAETGIVIVLKGTHPVIAADGKLHIIEGANPNLAKGGSGDVLSGAIGALLANNYRAEDAALLGCYVHQQAAKLLLDTEGAESLLATHLAIKIGDVFLQLNKHEDANHL